MTTFARTPTHHRWTVTTMWLGLGLTLLGMAYLAIDQLVGHGFADHLDAVYAGHLSPDQDPGDTTLLGSALYVYGALGAISWLVAIRGVRRNRPWTRPTAVVLLVVATSFAVLVATVREYGSTIFPPDLVALTCLPPAVGVVATTLLFRRAGLG